MATATLETTDTRTRLIDAAVDLLATIVSGASGARRPFVLAPSDYPSALAVESTDDRDDRFPHCGTCLDGRAGEKGF